MYTIVYVYYIDLYYIVHITLYIYIEREREI